uniref:Uncharacterized protein n=1 Tax=Anguilla anguilla TaxID=7936 RepID=A0A0E9UWD4_ANGAN
MRVIGSFSFCALWLVINRACV